MAENGRVIKRIVVGVDGSQHSAAALQWAINLARSTGAEIFAAFAVTPPDLGFTSYIPTPQVIPNPGLLTEMRRLLEDEWCAPLRSAQIPYQTLFEEGRPAVVVAGVADRVDADLVVVGRHGRGSLAEILLGSVSHELSQQCKRPLVLISQLLSRDELPGPTSAPALSETGTKRDPEPTARSK
ncbi:MAG: universal stress protein [Candidatus Dormibacteria bacterium]